MDTSSYYPSNTSGLVHHKCNAARSWWHITWWHSHDQINNSREICRLGHNNTARYLQCLLLNTMVIRNYLTVVVNGQYVSIVMTRSQTCRARMWPWGNLVACLPAALILYDIYNRRLYCGYIASRSWAQHNQLWSCTLLWCSCNSCHVISYFPGFTDAVEADVSPQYIV